MSEPTDEIDEIIQKREHELQQLHDIKKNMGETKPITSDATPLKRTITPLKKKHEDTIPKSEVARHILPHLRLIQNLSIIAMIIPISVAFCTKAYILMGIALSIIIAFYGAFTYAKTRTYTNKLAEKYNITLPASTLTRLLNNRRRPLP